MSESILIVLGAIGFLAAGAGLGYGLARLRARGESAKASEVQQAKAALESVPDTRVEMVAAIQNEIDEGTYKRDSKQVAKKIVNEHLRQSAKRKP